MSLKDKIKQLKKVKSKDWDRSYMHPEVFKCTAYRLGLTNEEISLQLVHPDKWEEILTNLEQP